MKVSKFFLTTLYITIPLGLFVILADQYFLGAKFKNFFAGTPETNFIFTLFFVEPHVVWSFLILADKEVSKKVWTLFTWQQWCFYVFIPLALLSVGAKYYLIYQAFISLKHVIFTQLGVGRMLIRTKLQEKVNIFINYALVISVVPHYISYLVLLDQDRHTWMSDMAQNYVHNYEMAKYIGLGIFIFAVLYNWKYLKQVDALAKLNYFGSLALPVFISFCLSTGYVFIGVLVARILHDMTSISFYYIYDMNRNRDERKNIFYNMPILKSLPIMYIAPMLVLVVSAVLTKPDWAVFAAILMAFELVHRLTENSMWKKESPLSKNISVA